ncbi:MAG TPA: zinc-dependent alcohol dehydrogenase family protein [Burkholderiaceae bacterium]|nr:zinc-dependent alcohol dehydrogenase family protein [Burkholderiaceae bacterium]
MRAIVLKVPGGPHALELAEVPTTHPGPGEVRVRAHAIGLGRPDVMMRMGTYKWMPPLPGIIGNEMAGVVDALGASVDSSWLGRPVLVSARELEIRGGCYAEQIVVPEAALIELPEGLDPADAVALPNYQLAWGLLHDATRGRLPQSLYLNGAAGGVGSALIQLGVQLGIKIVAGAGSEAKRRFARSQGAAAAIDSTMGDDALAQAVREATDGRGVDLVLDHLCGPAFAAHLRMLAPFGLLVSYNALAGVPAGDVFAALRSLGSQALGVVAYNMHVYNGPAMREARRALLKTPMQWLAERRIKPVIAERLPLSQVGRAHELLDRREVLGKLVLLPR